MTPRNEDFLFAQEAQRRGYIGEAQLEEGFLLQKRMLDELQIDERLAVILVKRGWLAEEQARRVYARIEPESETDEIEGYRIVEKIGHGAMGTVYKAEHLGLHRAVAIKILRRDLARDTTQVERLKEEAKILASLDHPNIVRALDAGESRGFPFVVMEYVDGETLKERIARQGPLHEIDALRIARGLADALERARRMGVVHRDVKPGNIILTRKDEPKLMDLGLAKGPVDLGLTQHGATVGTPQFISPEQAQDPRRADTRSDIYSLGATLYAMVTGRPPFQGTTLAEVLTKVLYEPPTPPRVLNKKVSPEVGYLIERMMLKDPGLRYRTPADVVHDIDEILAGRSIIPDGFTGNWEAYLLRQRIRRWTKIGITAAVTLLLLGAGAWYGIDRYRTEQRRQHGKEVIREVLLHTAPVRSDNAVEIAEKLLKARAAYDDWIELEPDGILQLASQVNALQGHARRLEEWEERVEKKADEYETAGRYDLAVQDLDGFLQRVPDPDDPARRLAHERRSAAIEASARAFEELRTRARRESAASLEEMRDQLRRYAKNLREGLYPDRSLALATSEADATVAALERALGEVESLEADSAADRLAPDLEALRFRALGRTFDERRTQILEAASRAWSRLEGEDWIPWIVVQELLKRRLDDVETARRALMVARGKAVEAEAGRLHKEGRTQQALDLLTQLGNAANDAGESGIRADALKAREVISKEWELIRTSADADLQAIEEDVLRMFREGDVEGIRDRVARVLAEREPGWPYRQEVADLEKLVDAWRDLTDAAFDGLLSEPEWKPERGVRLRDGRTDLRWTVRDYDRAAGTVFVSTGSGRPSEPRRLRDLHPDLLLELAGKKFAPSAVPPLLRAVAHLSALPEQTPDDLRELRGHLQAISRAFHEARYEGALASTLYKRSGDVSLEQERREGEVRSYFDQAKTLFNDRDFGGARFFLQRVLAKHSFLRYTADFDRLQGEIEAYDERVAKELANLTLADSFPGARVGLEGEMTWIEYDFENPIQLEVFKSGMGHATGRIEQYVNNRRPVTPSASDHRFTLLWGMRGLVRDRPLQLPCIFDPAEMITVEFDLHTLDSPFFLVVDIDGLKVGILSADPSSAAYRGRWQLPKDVPLLEGETAPPAVNFYGRGRGVTFHAGNGFGDPRTWAWPAEGRGRHWESWFRSHRKLSDLFAFGPQEVHRVKIVRDGGRIALHVDDRLVLESPEHAQWARIGKDSDRNPKIRNTGTGLIQILTWTPQAIDDLRLKGFVLERYRK